MAFNSSDQQQQYTYSCHLDGGYAANEVKIDLSEVLRELHVQAERNRDTSGRSDHRSVSRRLQIPDDVDIASVRCNYDEHSGRLEVSGRYKPKPKPPPQVSSFTSSSSSVGRTVNIPIRFK